MPTLPIEPLIQKMLKDKRLAALYLADCAQDEDITVFLIAIRNVMGAQDISMETLATQSGLSRENLYRALSAKGNPKLSTLLKVVNALGFNIGFTPVKKKKVGS